MTIIDQSTNFACWILCRLVRLISRRLGQASGGCCVACAQGRMSDCARISASLLYAFFSVSPTPRLHLLLRLTAFPWYTSAPTHALVCIHFCCAFHPPPRWNKVPTCRLRCARAAPFVVYFCLFESCLSSRSLSVLRRLRHFCEHSLATVQPSPRPRPLPHHRQEATPVHKSRGYRTQKQW